MTRVISLGAPPAATSLAPPACLRVQLADEEEADLLSQLPACVAFAADAARDGATLMVACHAGAPAAVTALLAPHVLTLLAPGSQGCRAVPRWQLRC